MPDAILCWDSDTWVAANKLATRYVTSAPITPITIVRFILQGHILMAGKDIAQYVIPRGWRAPRRVAMA
jgi:hypothetical protein